MSDFKYTCSVCGEPTSMPPHVTFSGVYPPFCAKTSCINSVKSTSIKLAPDELLLEARAHTPDQLAAEVDAEIARRLHTRGLHTRGTIS
jgi:hypothetical protein